MSNPVLDVRLEKALKVAADGNVALFIVPAQLPRHTVVTMLVHLLITQDHPLRPYMRATQDALHFEGTRGSVRVYPADHPTYDAKLKRLRDYPLDTPTFLHPEVDL